MCEKFKNLRVLAYTHRNIGQSLTLKGEHREAIRHFKESLNNFQYVGDEVNVGRIYVDLCLTYIQQNDLQKAKNMASWAQNIFLKTEQTYDAAYVTTLMGTIHRRNNQYDLAGSAFKESIELLNLKEPTPRLADALYEYGLLFMDLGDRQKALGRFEAALKIAEGLGLKKPAMRYFRAIEEVDEVRLVRLLMSSN
jgi:tetratricopeptide (TPR) repeat protein